MLSCSPDGIPTYSQGTRTHQAQPLQNSVVIAGVGHSHVNSDPQLGQVLSQGAVYGDQVKVGCTPTLTHKLCSKCKATKHASEFFKDKSKPDGLYSQVCGPTSQF
jgi:hypothetical protein